MSTQLSIIETVCNALKKIRQGDKIPGLPEGSAERFSITVKTVERSLHSNLAKDKYPAVFVANPTIYYRHVLSDVAICTMRYFIGGVLYQMAQSSTSNTGSITDLDRLSASVRAVLMANPTWSGKSLRSRIVSSDSYTETEEEPQGMVYVCETDFVEFLDQVPNSYALIRLPVDLPDCGSSRLQILNSLYNAFLDTEGIAFVERSKEWPIRPESISRQQTPGIWFHAPNEEYVYGGSRNTDKTISISVLSAALDFDLSTFAQSIDVHVARIKDVLGRHADLEDRVLTVDIKAIRTERSEYPIILLDVELAVRYIQSYEES